MITRNGQKITNPKIKNVSVANEILDVIEQGFYISPPNKKIDIATQASFAKEFSIHYQNLLAEKEYKNTSVYIEVVNKTTVQTARMLLERGHENIAALNFAAARNVGGGFLTGAKAQEEDLCRQSALYPCLKNKPQFYNRNILADHFYLDDIIYSPQVPFFKDDEGKFLEEPFPLSIITCPAPNMIGQDIRASEQKLKEIFERRIIQILKVAEFHEHRSLILGAWGCGAFCNDPEMVANAFKFAINKVPAFDYIVFAVYDTRDNQPVFNTFKNILMRQ